jgi:hypothetical protein
MEGETNSLDFLKVDRWPQLPPLFFRIGIFSTAKKNALSARLKSFVVSVFLF